MTNTERMARVGFILPPQETFVKVDPRGREYGEFTASLCPGGKVSVTWTSRGCGRSYTMLFHTEADFLLWAGECT